MDSRVELSDYVRTRAEQIMEVIRRGCNKAMPLSRPSNMRKKAVYWWDDHIASLRREYLWLRRRSKRARPGGSTFDEIRPYKEVNKSLQKAITREKNPAFQELYDDVNENTC